MNPVYELSELPPYEVEAYGEDEPRAVCPLCRGRGRLKVTVMVAEDEGWAFFPCSEEHALAYLGGFRRVEEAK